MIQPEINKDYTPTQIADFVLNNDNEGIFKSAALNREQFIGAIGRLNRIEHIIVFKGDELEGVFGWFFITEENKHLVGKQIWRLPEDLLNGDILYLAFIVTKNTCDLWAVKDMFEKMGYRKKISKIRGFSKNKWYEHNIRQYE